MKNKKNRLKNLIKINLEIHIMMKKNLNKKIHQIKILKTKSTRMNNNQKYDSLNNVFIYNS